MYFKMWKLRKLNLFFIPPYAIKRIVGIMKTRVLGPGSSELELKVRNTIDIAKNDTNSRTPSFFSFSLFFKGNNAMAAPTRNS
jgi:hypothetical protein